MNWRPAHEAHAIERANFSLFFQEEIPAKALNGAVDSITEKVLSLGFAPVVPPPPNNVFVVNIGSAVVQPQVEGRGFQLNRSGELIEELIFQKGFIAYSTTRYTRWKDVIGRIADLISPVAEKYISISNVMSLKLEYYDRFVFEGEPGLADFGGALSAGSKYLPEFYRDMKDLWHSHVGYFVPAKGGYKRLININVDALDVVPKGAEPTDPKNSRRSVGIYTMAEDRFWSEIPPVQPSSMREILTFADEMHLALKQTLAEVISPPLVDSISLNPKEG
ncbi:TIGR04255 family protein [Pleomorphomonas carboxyditropha]|nr:TIGR04255 family protein [Pleomorphomonas carboxyditropha]